MGKKYPIFMYTLDIYKKWLGRFYKVNLPPASPGRYDPLTVFQQLSARAR